MNIELQKEAALVVKAIDVYGGSFMRAIAGAMRRADIHNLQKIKDTWPREWSQYLDMSERMPE